MPTTEGEVRIRISGEDKATPAIKQVTNALKTMITGYLGYRGVQAVRDMINEFASYTSQIDKATKITGIASETIQKLGYAAEQEHASMQALNVGLRMLIRRMSDVKDGLAETKRAFANIGVSVLNADGSLRNVEDVFYEVARAIKNSKSETEASAIALELLGRAGSELVPFMRLGGEEIKRLGDEAEKMGLVLEDKTIKQGKIFSDQLTRINKEIQSLHLRISKDLLPTLLTLSENVGGLVKLYDKLKVAQEIAFAPYFINRIWMSIKPFRELLNILKELTGIKFTPLDKLNFTIKLLGESTEGTSDKVEKILSSIKPILITSAEGVNVLRDSYLGLLDGIKDVSDELVDTTSTWEKFIFAIGEDLKYLGKVVIEDFADTIASAMTDWITGASKALHEYVIDFIRSMTQMIIKALAFRAIMAAFGMPFGFEKGGMIPSFQTGGIIGTGRPPYGDRHLILGESGEGILTRRGVANVGGAEAVNRINRGESIANTFNLSINIQSAGVDYDANLLANKIQEILRRRMI